MFFWGEDPVDPRLTGPPFLYGYSEKPPHLVAFYDTLGIRILILNPRSPHGDKLKKHIKSN